MTNRETRELEALLFLFRPYIDKEAQHDYDVVYSRKFGYLFIQFYPEGNGEDQITLLETSHDLLFMMFSWSRWMYWRWTWRASIGKRR